MIVIAVLLASPWPARAQDFVSASIAGPSPSPLVLLEDGLPSGRTGIAAEASVTRWWGLPDLATRSVAIGASFRSLRCAGGISQTGEADLGWSSAGVALGAAGDSWGVALRGVARRDRDRDAVSSALGPGLGAEAGAGAFIEPSPGLAGWASAPQLWTRGLAPPLTRALEIGGRASVDDFIVWLAQRAAPRTGAGSGVRTLGIALSIFPLRVWVEARNHPLRGTAGVEARAGGLSAGLEIESHPALGETVRVSLGWGAKQSMASADRGDSDADTR